MACPRRRRFWNFCLTRVLYSLRIIYRHVDRRDFCDSFIFVVQRHVERVERAKSFQTLVFSSSISGRVLAID